MRPSGAARIGAALRHIGEDEQGLEMIYDNLMMSRRDFASCQLANGHVVHSSVDFRLVTTTVYQCRFAVLLATPTSL
ncbi:hypothetical protein LEMLEM_LOCUS27321 [Lemmus lemmus]